MMEKFSLEDIIRVIERNGDSSIAIPHGQVEYTLDHLGKYWLEITEMVKQCPEAAQSKALELLVKVILGKVS